MHFREIYNTSQKMRFQRRLKESFYFSLHCLLYSDTFFFVILIFLQSKCFIQSQVDFFVHSVHYRIVMRIVIELFNSFGVKFKDIFGSFCAALLTILSYFKYTGLPTKEETSETTFTWFCLFTILHSGFSHLKLFLPLKYYETDH